MSIRYNYSKWDGTQEPFKASAEELLDELTKDVLAYGNLESALQRLVERGMQTRQGMRIQGLRDLINQLRREKERQLKQFDLDSMMEDLKEKLDQIVDMERRGLEKRLEDARAETEEGPGEGMQEMLERMVQRKKDTLDGLPESPGGMFKELMDYEFFDEEAREEFQKLLDMLRQKMLDPYARDMAERMSNMGAGEMDAIKRMLSDLNEMLERQRMGLDSGYNEFKQRYGRAFPDMPDTLEEFVEELQRRISQMQSLMNSLSDEARESLEQMMQSQLTDPDLADLMASLAENLEALHPTRRRKSGYPFEGEEELSWDQAMELMSKLQNMEELEAQLRKAQASRGLEGIDTKKLNEVLGQEAEEDIEALRELARELEEAGYLRFKDGRMELSPKGLRRIGQKALREIFGHMKKDRRAAHEIQRSGIGLEDVQETKTYEFGDPFRLNIPRTILNAVERSGPGIPVNMSPEDLEIYKPEHQTQSATVLLLDQSRSMDMSGDFFGAKKVALALHSLISGQYPKDDFHIIGFSLMAKEIKARDLPEAGASDSAPGTNMQHGLQLAREYLAKRKCENKQIIMITDGEPTAHMEQGYPYFAWPPSLLTVQATLQEVKRCTKDRITLNVFMLDTSYYLIDFMEQVTKINRGRAFFTTADRLGEYILVDYINHKRTRIRP